MAFTFGSSHQPAIPETRRAGTTAGDRWFVDETFLKNCRWVYLYRAIDQYGQVIDGLVQQSQAWRWSKRRDQIIVLV